MTPTFPTFHLTHREMQIKQGTMLAKSNKEIAYDLGITENTVKVYSSRLYQKLGIHTRLELSLVGRNELTKRCETLERSNAALILSNRQLLAAEQDRKWKEQVE